MKALPYKTTSLHNPGIFTISYQSKTPIKKLSPLLSSDAAPKLDPKPPPLP